MQTIEDFAAYAAKGSYNNMSSGNSSPQVVLESASSIRFFIHARYRQPLSEQQRREVAKVPRVAVSSSKKEHPSLVEFALSLKK
jgi:hypothetical protein